MMQAALPVMESTPMLAVLLVSFLAGSLCPTYYASERFRGFGRVMLGKLPYAPPPGQETEQALIQATDADGDGEGE